MSKKLTAEQRAQKAVRQKRYRQKHKTEREAYDREWQKKNKDKMAIYRKQYRQDHKDKIAAWYRNHELIRKFGINLEEYNKLLIAQEYKCAICGKHQSELLKALHVDHCHKTGEIRGLLCQSCNLALGNVFDDIWILEHAIKYLQIHLVD